MTTETLKGSIKGFIPQHTHHCTTGSMWNIYTFNRYPVSEEVLFGLGSGIGFAYLEIKGAAFLGGRGNIGRKGEDGIEIAAAKRTGVKCQRFTTASVKKAESCLLGLLNKKTPVMLYVDMGYLPYFNLPPDMHFGADMVVAAGYDPGISSVLIADRDGLLHPVSLSTLATARNSKFKPFPPKNAWYEMEFSNAHPIATEDVIRAIFEACERMIHPPISSLGVKGIYKAARRIPNWSEILDKASLQAAIMNGYIYIDATGGTGGGLFRYMYSRFLHEAINYTGIDDLNESSIAFKNIGDRWQEIALLFKDSLGLETPKATLNEIGGKLEAIAEMEEAAWDQLYHLIQG